MKLRVHHKSPGGKNLPFEQWWDETAALSALHLAVITGSNARDQRRHYDQTTATIKAHRRKAYKWLKKAMSPTDELLDIMAGMGRATIPLVLDNHVNAVTLVEAMGMDSMVIKVLREKMGLSEKIQLIETPIDSHTAPGSLPNIQNVTLIFTGLIFAPNDRAGSPEDWTKEHRNLKMRIQGVRGHMPPNSRNNVELTDVLRGLGNQKRVIWVADAPRLGLKEGVTRSRTHVEATLGAVDSGWKIAEWESKDGEEMIFGKLVHE